MTCRDVLEFLMDYQTGALPPSERALFDAHLTICPSCVAYLESYNKTIHLCKSLAAKESTLENVPPELIQAILAVRGAGKK